MEELLKRLKSGDEEAYDEIVNIYQKKLYTKAVVNLENSADADDVVQETLIKIFENINTLKDVRNFDAWAHKILLNECRRFLLKCENTCSYEEISAEYFVSEGNVFNDIDDNINFCNIIASNKDVDKEILIMYFVDNYTTKQIAEILNLNENTIKSRIRRSAGRIKEVKGVGKHGC